MPDAGWPRGSEILSERESGAVFCFKEAKIVTDCGLSVIIWGWARCKVDRQYLYGSG
jgi:hypothetical protein